MRESERINVYLAPAVAARMKQMAETEGVSYAAIMREALGVLQVMRDATRDGLYVGTTRNRAALETLIVAP